MKRLAVLMIVFGVMLFFGCPVPLPTINLCQKSVCSEPPDPGEEWPCDSEGAAAVLGYSPEGPVFAFEVQGVVPQADKDYTLIYYPDPWPGTGLLCLGTTTPDAETGAVAFDGAAFIGQDLPICGDENCPEGAKIWLVPSDDVDCTGQQMIAWNCTDILFETVKIQYDYTPGDP